jgi:TonB-dependent receptor
VATDAEGGFALGQLPPGSYTLIASYLGYADATATVTLTGSADRAVDIAMQADVLKLGRFVVEGEREGQARALQQKRTADNILDVVSADSAGKLPDGNAAEAVRRLPGVFAEIDQNEGRYIVVRGIDAALNNITVNGVSVGSTESGTRGAAMDAVPADLISRIEVVKAVTPDMDHQAIGASVNIVTPSAFDRGETFAHGTVAGGVFNGPKTDLPLSASATYGTTFGGGKWGFLVGASHSYRHYISNRQSGGNPWLPAGPAGSAGADVFSPRSTRSSTTTCSGGGRAPTWRSNTGRTRATSSRSGTRTTASRTKRGGSRAISSFTARRRRPRSRRPRRRSPAGGRRSNTATTNRSTTSRTPRSRAGTRSATAATGSTTRSRSAAPTSGRPTGRTGNSARAPI